MQRILDFFTELSGHNEKPWFDAHKDEYLKCQAYFDTLVSGLVEEVGKFDPAVKGLTVRQCTYRIYRDLRFSKDKTPYKNHIGAYICPFGKNSGYSGYYFHIQPVTADTMFDTKSNLLAAGMYWAPPEVIKSIREDIDCNGENFDKAVKSASGFALDGHDMLKRVPLPYPQDHPYAEYLKHRSWSLEKSFGEDVLFSEDPVRAVAAEFHKAHLFNNTINRAVAYAYDRDWPY